VPYLNMSKIKQQIRGTLTALARNGRLEIRWVMRNIKNWRRAMHRLCSDRIDYLAKTRKYVGPILSNRKSKAELDRLREI
jgi:hypothetical protein